MDQNQQRKVDRLATRDTALGCLGVALGGYILFLLTSFKNTLRIKITTSNES